MRSLISKHAHSIDTTRMLRGAAALTAALALLLAAALPLAAQNEGDFSEGFSTESESEGDTESGEKGSGGDSGFSSFAGSEGGDALQWGGFLETAARYSLDYDDLGAGTVDTYPTLGLDLSYTKDNSEAVAELRFSRNWTHEKGLGTLVEEALPAGLNGLSEDNVQPAMSFKWYLQRMINQAHIRLFYDHFNIQAGFMKEVWGTGDQVHVVDLLNPTDYYDFVNVDYMERKIAEFMLKGNVRLGESAGLELVYVPTFTPDSIPQTGPWSPKQLADLETLIRSVNDLPSPPYSPSITYPVPHASLEDGQYAARLKGSFGGVDLGAIYYYGRSHQPALSAGSYVTLPTGDTLPQEVSIEYPRMNLFGLESAAVLAGFNLRAEAAFTMTDDTDEDGLYESRGDNPAFHYVAGFDRDLGISNLNLNIQGTGAYYWNVGPDAEELNTTVSAALTDSWNNGRIDPELSFAYSAEGTELFEDPDFMLRPSVTFTLVDDVSLEAEYAYFYGPESGRFGQFEENDFLQLRLNYEF